MVYVVVCGVLIGLFMLRLRDEYNGQYIPPSVPQSNHSFQIHHRFQMLDA